MYQVPLIEKAKEMGLEVHVCSQKGNYPGIDIAPFFYEIDISDKKNIFSLAKRLNIDGILTTATDVCLESIGHVVNELNLSGTGLEDSKACLDKNLMKQRFIHNGVPTPNYLKVNNLQDAIKFFNKRSKSCVLKPTDSSGSRGVTKVECISEIEFAFNEAFKFSKTKNIIIEEWLEGEEFGAQAVVIDNELALLILHSDITTTPPHRIPIGHGCPHPKESTLYPLTLEIVNKAIIALGVNNVVCNIDFIQSSTGPQIIEMTCRMGGTRLPEVCGEYWGVNFYELAVKLSLGIKPEIPLIPTGLPNAAHNLNLTTFGIIEKFGKMNKDFEWKLTFNEGEKVSINAANQIDIGYVHVKGADAQTVLTDATFAAQKFCNTIAMREVDK